MDRDNRGDDRLSDPIEAEAVANEPDQPDEIVVIHVDELDEAGVRAGREAHVRLRRWRNGGDTGASRSPMTVPRLVTSL